MFSENLKETLKPWFLLQHPFYKAWNEGCLDRDILAFYAAQYSHHVKAFPQYVSSVHSMCPTMSGRPVLLENLIEEERGSENHPELWARFAESVGARRSDLENSSATVETKELVDTFYNLTRSSYAAGLGALYAYEYQVPEVSTTKIDGLKKFYHVNDERGLSFFKVHQEADVLHTQEVANLLEGLSEKEKVIAKSAACEAAKALWKFLDGVEVQRQKAVA